MYILTQEQLKQRAQRIAEDAAKRAGLELQRRLFTILTSGVSTEEFVLTAYFRLDCLIMLTVEVRQRVSLSPMLPDQSQPSQ